MFRSIAPCTDRGKWSVSNTERNLYDYQGEKMIVPENDGQKVGLGGETSPLSISNVTKRNVLETVKSEQLRCALESLVVKMIRDSDFKVDGTGTLILNYVEEPVPDVTEGFKVSINLSFPDLRDQRPINEIMRKSLDIPLAPELRRFSDSEVHDLIGDVLKQELYNNVEHIFPGRGGSAALVFSPFRQIESGLASWKETAICVQIGQMLVYPMSVSNLGNFLHAFQNYGRAVALATLHQIYSETL
jgi:hypothetical protein